MHVDRGTLHELVDNVWSSMLGLPLRPSLKPYEQNGAGRISSTVSIAGSWEATVVIDLPLSAARTVTATMFEMDEAEVDESEIHDAVGELVNMIGGNVKGLAEGDCKLSLPTVADGRDFTLSVRNSSVEAESVFETGDTQFLVQVLIRSES